MSYLYIMHSIPMPNVMEWVTSQVPKQNIYKALPSICIIRLIRTNSEAPRISGNPRKNSTHEF